MPTSKDKEVLGATAQPPSAPQFSGFCTRETYETWHCFCIILYIGFHRLIKDPITITIDVSYGSFGTVPNQEGL